MTDDNRFPAERAETVLALLREQGRVSSTDLAHRFGVSEDSIRRDLRELASRGLCRRVYGGAVRVAPDVVGFDQRISLGASDKAGLAAGICSLLQPKETIFLDAGTTNLSVAESLPENIDLTIITNSPQIAIAAGHRRGVRVQLIGGTYSSQAGAVLGAESLLQLQRLRIDVCVPGACAIDPMTGVWATDAEEAALKRMAVSSSSRVIVGASSEKLGCVGTYHVADLADIDEIVLPAGGSKPMLQMFTESGIRVIETSR